MQIDKMIDETFEWKGHGTPAEQRNPNTWTSRCRLRVYTLSETGKEIRHVMLLSDPGEDAGTSITNSLPRLATLIANKYLWIRLEESVWVEHYPCTASDPREAKRVEHQESNSGIVLTWKGRTAKNVGWRPMTRAELTELIGEEASPELRAA